MPIDFAPIADAFRPLLQQQLRTSQTVFTRLGRWLKPLVSAAEKADRATRDVPILLIRHGAVAATIDVSQWGALRPGAPPATFGSTVRGSWDRFVRGLALIPHMVNEELVLPRAGAALLDAVDAVIGAVERVMPIVRRAPGSERLFDLDRQASASGLFGGGALLGLTAYNLGPTLRSMTADATALMAEASGTDWAGLADPITQAVDGLLVRFGFRDPAASATDAASGAVAAAMAAAVPAAPSGASSSSGLGGIAAALDAVARGVLGTILLLPLLPGLAAPLLQAALLRGRVLVLDAFQAIERSFFAVRRSILDAFTVTLPKIGTWAYDLLVVTGVVVGAYLEYGVDFATEYLQQVHDRFIPYIRRLSSYIAAVTGVLGRIMGVWRAIMDFEIVEWLVTAVGIPASIWRRVPGRPTLTVGELIEGLMAGTATALLGAVGFWLARVYTVFRYSPAGGIDYLAGSPIATRLRAARNVVVITAARLPGSHLRRPRMTPAPGPLPSFPNLAQTVAGSPLDQRLLAAQLTTLGLRARLSTLRTFNAGALALDQTAVALDQASARAVRAGGSRARLARLSGWADALGSELYDGQIGDLRRQTQADSFGRQFDGILARRGFEVLEAALPLYVEAMRSYWHARVTGRAQGRFAPSSGLPPYDPPTSPHIVDRRARLGRVRVPRLTVRATARPVTRGLADAVASHVRHEVERAYTTGLDRIAD